jgi:GT2 family glycosyltransferase/2-polyprenyl-3-methyl-5-hydroxy-6-metoxy-1,4-benzoquinol methylase
VTGPADLAVVIPTIGRPGILERTLAALREQTVQGFEVVIVFDGPEPPATGLEGARVLRKPHGGPAAARNHGVAATDRDLVLFLGDDMIPEPDLVAAHLKVHRAEREDEVAVLGHVDWHPEVRRNRILRWLDWSATQFDYDRIADLAGEDVGFGRFYSCNVSLKRALLDRVGGFDEDFLYYYEDLDMGYRLGEAGMRLRYEPRAVARHLHDYALEAIAKRFEGIALGERLMADKHGWFEPFFKARVEEALAEPPARGFWPYVVDVLPRGTRLRRRAEQRANRWYHRHVADRFVRSWARAGELVELRRYLGERFDPQRVVHHASAVEEESAAVGDETAFYRTSETYLYDLTVFAMSGIKDPYHDALRAHLPTAARVLDFGCGIGADGLRLAEHGYRVAFADFDNPSTRYLRWRLDRRGLDAPVYDIERDDIPSGFDAAFAFDVIEHVADPVAFLERLEQRAAIVAVNLLEDDPHDHEHHLHRPLPIDELVARARSRGLLTYAVHHARSHLIVYRGDA